MTIDEAQKEFALLQKDIKGFKEEVEVDAHMEFVNYLKQYVNKY